MRRCVWLSSPALLSDRPPTHPASALCLQHVARKKQIDEWVAASTSYLNVAEKIEAISTAHLALNQLKAYEADKVVQTNTAVTSLRALGEKILTAGTRDYRYFETFFS